MRIKSIFQATGDGVTKIVQQKHQTPKILKLYNGHFFLSRYTVGEKKDSTLHRVYGVKLPLLRAVWAGQGLILPLEK